VQYRARFAGYIEASGSSYYVESDWSPIVNVYMPLPTKTLVKNVWSPSDAIAINRNPGDSVANEPDETELHPAGRDADAVFGRDWTSGDKGTLTIPTSTDLELYRLQRIVAAKRTLLIQWNTGGQTYVHVSGLSIVRPREPDGTLCRTTLASATMPYVEQARPV